MFIQNSLTRWELDGYELTSGSVLDVWLDGHWLAGRVEYSHKWKMYILLIPNGRATLLLSFSLTVRLPQER